jgi:hypothetical protein
MIITKYVEGFGNVWYDNNNPDMENMFRSAAIEPLKNASVEEQEEQESDFITLKKMTFGEIK